MLRRHHLSKSILTFDKHGFTSGYKCSSCLFRVRLEFSRTWKEAFESDTSDNEKKFLVFEGLM